MISRARGGPRAIATATLAVLLMVTGGRTAGAQLAPREVITRAELEAGGWTRLSELPFAARGVARTTVDGIAVLGSVSGLPAGELAPGRDAWLVFIDGQLVESSFVGVSLLDLLPVSLTQLDSVVVRRGPTFIAGRLALHGVLQLHTQRTRDGTHASASHYSGNEVGDAGPFTFTPRGTPNVDNAGPFHAVRAVHGSAAWDMDLAWRRWTDNLTDRRIAARHEAAAAPEAPELWVRHRAPTVKASLQTAGGRHDLHAGVAQLRGTTFIPSIRVDHSARTELGFVGVSGTERATAATSAWYRASASELETKAYGAPLPTFGNRQRTLGAAAGVRRQLTHGWVGAGGAATRSQLLDAPAPHAPTRAGVNDLQGFVEGGLSVAWQPQGAATVGRGLDGVRASASAMVTPIADSISRLGITFAAERKRYGDDGAWIDLEALGLGALAPTRRVSAVADVAWTRIVPHDLQLTLGTALRRETGLLLLTGEPAGPGPEFVAEVSPPLTLTLGEVRAALELPWNAPIAGGAAYRFTQSLGGWTTAQEAALTLPRHLLDADVTFTAFGDIRVRPAASFASRTRWHVAGTTELVPAVTRLDLSLEKWFVRRHLRAQLLARNLLNDVERYHPLGADFRLRVYAGATLSF